MALQAKLDGLDAPSKVALTDPTGKKQAAVSPVINLIGKPIDQFSDEELCEFIDAEREAEERRRLNLVGPDNDDSR